jgi:hypothetical protein
VLASLFMHDAFDLFLAREFPTVEFERYADDAVVHCVTERQARAVWAALAERMASVGLRLHPDKTRIVYCKDGNRRSSFEHTSFRFLGYTFRSRKARNADGRFYAGFLPAVSREALKEMGQQVRSWRAGWTTSAGSTGRRYINSCNASIPTRCGGRGRNTGGCAPSNGSGHGGPGSSIENPACSSIGPGTAISGGFDEKSGMTGDCHVPFCGSPGVRFPRATRPSGW